MNEATKESIRQAVITLRRKSEQVTPEILDQLEKLIPLFRGMNASTVQAAALACGIKTDVNLAAMTALMKTMIDHEKTMLGGMNETSIAFLEQALCDPSKLSEVGERLLG